MWPQDLNLNTDPALALALALPLALDPSAGLQPARLAPMLACPVPAADICNNTATAVRRLAASFEQGGTCEAGRGPGTVPDTGYAAVTAALGTSVHAGSGRCVFVPCTGYPGSRAQERGFLGGRKEYACLSLHSWPPHWQICSSAHSSGLLWTQGQAAGLRTAHPMCP